jgi:hypothetical protein
MKELKQLNAIDHLLKGSIDMHAHYGPDAAAKRKVDALRGAQQAAEAGLRAIVLKSHEYPTAPLAYTINQTVTELTAFGSITLNYETGGLNPAVVETSAKLGAKVVWMPTLSSNYDYLQKKVKTGGISILDQKGKLLPVVKNILEIVKRYDIVIATGHLPVNECFILVEKAAEMGLRKIVATHPLGFELNTYFTVEQQCQIADLGAIVEYCFVTTLPEDGMPVQTMVEAIRAVGVGRCVLSTDLGQAHNPPPAEGMKLMIAILLSCGLTEKEIEILVKINPARLLGIT